MKYRRYPRIVFFLIFSTLFFTTLNYLSASGSQTAEERVFAAWYKAQDIGEYTYDARIEQVSRPLPMLINVGLSSHTERILVQGQVDLDDKLLDLKMWNSGGSVLNESQAVEIQIRDGETKGRVGDSDWEEVDDISSLYIPGRDALGILYAAVNIQDAGPETRANITFTRYTFDIDGPAYAHYMRTQLEQELARKGALPHGMEIELADQFVNMSGYGEIWIDEVGLPLRQTMFMQFPPAETEQVEATTTIDFSSWGTDPFANLTRFQRQVVRIDKGAIVDGTAVTGFVFLQIALIGFLFTRFNWQKIYRTSSIILVLSMLFSPLLQATATHASAQNLSQIMGHQRTLEAEQEEAQQIQEEMMMPTFDTAVSPQQQNPFQDETPEFENFPTILPNSLPLAIPATLTATIPDTDGDGLNDTLEAEAGTDINNPDSDGDGLNDMQEVILLETDPKNVDTDSDTLSDYIEYVEIGTDPLYFDTDNDLLSDKAEVQGFLDSTNTRYYTNPLEADTNMDGQTDGVECLNLVDVKTDDLGYAIGFGRTLSPNESCQDTDNDGTPDVLDLDNDNDGVTDRNDIDPYTALGGGEKPACGGLNPGLPETAGCVEGFINQTFNLKINSFEDNKPLLVDFQLRPEESSHLWYNLHVLDWPDNDQQGQIRTGSEQTFGNSGAQANGDLRLIPMLSVEIPPSGYGTLPLSGTIPTDPSAPLSSWLNTDKLDQFNITVRQLDERGTLEALVPINMVTDQVSQSPVAFSAQMYYQPTVENWQADHQVKLIWLVQVINEDGDAQIVHTYNDDWYLTGLAVTENHGVKAGLIYEDPIFAQTVDGYADDTYYEGSLWTLSTALNHTFLSGRRDVDIEALKTRLDKNSNGVIPADNPQLFGIGKETLFVDLFEYEHVGELGYLPGEIATVLDTTFTPLAVQDKFTAPLIMIVREESTKTVGLTGSGILTQDGVDLRFAADVVIQAGMQWSPYQFDPDTNEWETYLPQSYWQDHLEPRIQAEFDQSLPEILNHYETHKEAIDRGASRVAASYFFANKLGATATVQQGDKPLISASSLSDSEILQFNLYNDLKKEMGVSKAVVQSISTVVKQAGVSLAPSLKTAGNSTTIKAVKELFLEHSAVDNALVKAGGNSGPNNLLKQFAAQGRTAIKAGAVAILAIVALSLAIGFITKDAAIAIDVGQTTALVAFQMVSVVASVKQLATAAGGFKALASSASGFVNAAKTIGSNISKFAKITAAIGIAIAVGVAVGVFIAQVASGSIDLGTQAGREAIATLVATIIVAVIMGVIGLIPGVGVLIVAIIGVIDAVIGLICRAAGIDQDPKYSLLCGGISGLLTKFVKAIIYSYQTVVKTSHEDRVLTGIPGTHLQNPEEGYAAGNTFIITMPITRSLFKNSPNSLGSIVSAASGFFTDENAKSSIFDYDLISGDSERHNSLVGRQRWIPATGEADFTFVDTIDYVVVMQPGVNFDFDIHFSEAYRVDSIECVTFVCDWDDERKTNNSYIEGFEYDILPETFAEFVTMANQGGGDYSFGWWYTTPPTGLTLPTFRDADGDGLVSTAHGGSDDGDNAPDRDSDGLDDLIESQMGSNPIMQDTDSDGLSDYLELLYGTKPTQADTDNDGLRDGEEIAGWEFVYAFDAADQPLSTWVRSDPLNPDTDGDNISDKLEEVYGFNPQVNSSPDVLEIETAVYEYIEVPAGADCATVTLDTITVQDAVRNDLEYAEHIDAELEIRMDGLRVWYQDGILDGDSFPINKSVDFCDREVPIEVIELDQGDWNNDVVVNIDVSPQNGSETRQFSSAPQGSQLTLSWTMSDYTDATVLVRKASDGYVAPGQELAYIGEVENVLRNRLAFGLLDVEFSAGLPNDTLYEQPFVLPARQVTGVRGQVTVDPAISASQIVSFTNQVGALIDPDTEPAPETVTDPITPTLWLQFDNGTEYDNVGTGAGLTIDTTTANSRDPMTGETGRLNEAIKFEGRDHVYVSGNDVQLTNGRFTIATWLMRDNANSNGTIMGWAPDGNPGDYPRLWVRDGHIGVSFEGSGGSCTHETTTDFLGSGQWEHVAVTFDQGQIRFYVNGAIIDSHPGCSGNLPNATHNEFFIGRGHHHATITFHSIHVTDEADGAGDAELELYGRYGGGANGGSYRLGDWGSLEDGDNITINQAHAIAGDDRYNFIICERDNDDSGCNTGDGDTSNLDTDYYNYETGYHSRGYSGDGTGTIDFTVSEGATYLNGVTLDEFQIYTEDISSDQIRDLIMSVDANLLMPLNEQPASVKFYDHSGNKQHGICLGSGCPTTGILGREGQAARFDGVNDYVVLTEDTPEDFRLLDDNITVAMWVKPETATGALFTVGDDSLDAATLGLTPNQWHHVAWVLEEVGGSYELHTYRDTALVNTTPLAAHPFAAGEAVYFGGTDSGNSFNGLIDQLKIYPAALDTPSLTVVMTDGGNGRLPLNDPPESVTFENLTGADGTCTNCPDAGVDGQIYGALNFDGIDDEVNIPNSGQLNGDSFSVAMWVKPVPGVGASTMIRAMSTGAPAHFQLDMNGPDDRVGFNVCGTNTLSQKELNANMWSHIVLTYKQDENITLYLNGTEDSQVPAGGHCSSTADITLGIRSSMNYAGMMDELVLFGNELSDRDVRELYNYEIAWVDNASSVNIIVDTDAPSASLNLAGSYLPNQDVILQVSADDIFAEDTPFSGIELVEYRVDGGDWMPATADGQAWLFTFMPTGGATYSLDVRATDKVGHVSAINSSTVTVDDTLPTMTIDSLSVSTGSIDMSGTVADTSSGVDNASGLAVLSGANGRITQAPANITGGSWTATLSTTVALYGIYTATIQVADVAGNVYSAAETVEIDQTPPQADVTKMDNPESVLTGIDANQPALFGTAVDIPVPLNPTFYHHFEDSNDANTQYFDGSILRNHAHCSAGACPTSGMGQLGQGLTFDGDDLLTIIHDDAIVYDGQLTGHNTFALGGWVNLDATSGVQTVFAYEGTGSEIIYLRFNGDDFRFGWHDGTESYALSVANTAVAGQWMHIVVAYDGFAWKVYQNGVIIKTDPQLVGAPSFNGTWRIGATDASTHFLSGQLDELFLYPTGLQAEQIYQLANPISTAGVASVEVGRLHLQDVNTPASTVWEAATLATPNALYSTWSYSMPLGIEGPYKLFLRATDLNGDQAEQEIWQGEIDTQAPQITLHKWNESGGANPGAHYACDATDYNLTLAGFNCPVPTGTKVFNSEPWFTALYSDSQKLSQINGGQGVWLPDSGLPYQLEVCDQYGNCNISIISSNQLVVNNALSGPLATVDEGVWIVEPLASSGTNNPTAAVTISGTAYAVNGLADLQIDVNGSMIYTETFGTNPTEANWLTSWVPGATGVYTITAVITDMLGTAVNDTAHGEVGRDVFPTVLYVNDQPPTIDIGVTNLMTTSITPQGTAVMTGTYSDLQGAKSISVTIDGGTAVPAVINPDGTWTAHVPFDTSQYPDGVSLNVEATILSLSEQTVVDTQAVGFDFVSPEVSNTTFTYVIGAGSPVTVTHGATIPGDATLTVDWTATDGGGVASYQADWFNTDASGAVSLLLADTPGSPSSSYSATEGQLITLTLTTTDNAGNSTVNVAGPFFIDGSNTPAVIDGEGLSNGGPLYHHWLEESCNRVGVDHRLQYSAIGLGAASPTQSLYATWDDSGLLIAWAGADFAYDGDLFFYFNTGAGGMTTAYDPYATVTNTAILLPAQSGDQMAANFGLMIEDGTTATFLAESGGAWTTPAATYTLAEDYYLGVKHTYVHVPFATLGITNADPVEMVAFASEEDALRLWSAIPADNPLNSDTIVPNADGQPVHLFALTDRLAWAGLADGVCPSDGYVDAQLQFGLTASPEAAPYALVGDGLFWAMSKMLSGLTTEWVTAQTAVCTANPTAPLCAPALIDNPAPAGIDFYAPATLQNEIDVNPTPLADGTAVSVTIRVTNMGSETATGVRAAVDTWGRIAVSGGTPAGGYTVYDLPDVVAGETLTYTINGDIDNSADPTNDSGWATLDIVVYDDTGSINGPIDWLSADFRVDDEGPSFVDLNPAIQWLGGGENSFQGTYVDVSAVPTMTLRFDTDEVVCANETAVAGQWACTVDLSALGLTDGQSVAVDVRGTDVHGQESGWFNAGNLTVDLTPPDLTLSTDTVDLFADGYVSSNESTYSGTTSDDRMPSHIEVCQVDGGDEACSIAPLQLSLPILNQFYSDGPASPIDLNGGTSCGGGEVNRVINVADSFTVADLNVGLQFSHAFRNDVYVTLQSPGGTAVTILSGGTIAENGSLLLDDSATLAWLDDWADHATGAVYSQQRRPFSPLTAFNGENAAGNWTVSLCDQNGGLFDGSYISSELRFTEAGTAVTDDQYWTVDFPLPSNTELFSQTIRFYAVDQVGNRSAAVAFDYTLDTIPPELTFSFPQMLNINFSELSGTATDNIGVAEVTLAIQPPFGEPLQEVVQLAGTNWTYTDVDQLKDDEGLFALYFEAIDIAGNHSRVPARDLLIGANVPPAQIVLNPVTSHNVEEDGAQSSYTIALSGAPVAPVTITLGITEELDIGLGQGMTQTLIFDASNWNYSQAITITAFNDAFVEPVETVYISHTMASLDAYYGSLDGFNVAVNIVSDDVPGITDTDSGGTTAVTEGGPADSFTLKADSSPYQPVLITIYPDIELDLGLGPAVPITHTIDVSNWDTPFVVDVLAHDDGYDEPLDPHTGVISFTISSADAMYDALTISDKMVPITDNDTAGVTLDDADDLFVHEGILTDTYTLQLDSTPYHPVEVVIDVDPELDYGAGPGQAITTTLDVNNWDSGYPALVAAYDDTVLNEGIEVKVVTHTLTSLDPDYNNLVFTRTVTINDNDYRTYLPYAQIDSYPDLIVESVSVSGSTDVTIVIRNIGDHAVSSEFWVDLYIGLYDTNNVPAQVNDIWQNFSPRGATWIVTEDAMPIGVGETLTLTVNDAYFDATESNLGSFISTQVPLYVQVDSANVIGVEGGVMENHEFNGQSYNNVAGPFRR